jgi:toxin ParE1/3/4
VRAELHAEAQREFTETAHWYETCGEGLGDTFAVEFLRALDVIEEAPETWPEWPGTRQTPPIRRFLLSGFPFALPYMVLEERVVILAVAHVRRHPGYWLSRAKALELL